MTLTGLIGATYILDSTPLGSGGEGDIYKVRGMDSQVAKIYKSGIISKELEEKLTVMIENPPIDSVLSQVAWPLDIVYAGNGQACGFIMPKLSINAELGDIYKYPAVIPISVQQKLNIAQNICVVIAEVHQAGYVFGDFNPRNIGLDKNTGLVSFLDTDTYHVVNNANGNAYRCIVCAPGYAAPELLARCSDYIAENPSASKNAYAMTPLPTFTKETDNFALAIHIFKLLMNGYTPFGGIIESLKASQATPGVGDAAVRRDSYCFKPGMKPQSVAIPPLDVFPKEVMELFARAFIDGKKDPKIRPTAVEWHDVLNEYEKKLVTCANNPLHQYYKENLICPLCEADERFAVAMGAPTASMPTHRSLSQTLYRKPPPPVVPTLSPPSVHISTPKPSPVITSAPRRTYTFLPKKSWTCKCGLDNDSNSLLCLGCGEYRPTLPPSLSPKAKITSFVPKKSWICKCGLKNDSNNLLCLGCGEYRPTLPPSLSPRQSSVGRKWLCKNCNEYNNYAALFCKSCGKYK